MHGIMIMMRGTVLLLQLQLIMMTRNTMMMTMTKIITMATKIMLTRLSKKSTSGADHGNDATSFPQLLSAEERVGAHPFLGGEKSWE